ncbi:MAG TPA: group III truncated hemoglobin [Steroidobacteraceae bacterium]|jgi:hemoglobin
MSDSEAAGLERRELIIERIRAETGIDDAMIETLVHAFYARVREDALIGPIFNARVANWHDHLQRMCSFWSSVTLMSGRYHGQPMQKHVPLPVEASHFDRWLELFRQTAREVCTPQAADLFIARAQLIAQSLEMGIASAQGVLLDRGQRLGGPRAQDLQR